ncbi:MAG TPA: amino acid adenylation domain-containing protein, partial [Thermoanaerobaculia bacterium]|nr:amino acid adenylation domain-containing protein [Thermoanaerobaculia bacterium]
EASGGQGLDLRALLGRGGQAPKPHPLHETHVAQPAVLAVSWALAQLWLSWGVRPQALLGYSLGEYTAACLAGVMSLEDGLTLVACRAQLIAGLPPGAMLAVPLGVADLLPRLAAGLSLAAENGPGVSVVAGPLEAVDALERQLTGEGFSCRRLPTTHAFHSAMMEPVREALAETVAGLRLAPPSLPYLSNLTGTWITAEQATDPHYWADHLCRPVRFGRALETLWAQSQRVLLEVGPGQGLSTLALQHPSHRDGLALASLRHSQDRQPDDLFLLGALTRLWLAGVAVDWEGFAAGETRQRVPLPTYPFERRRYWIDPPRRNGSPAAHRQTSLPPKEDRTATAIPAPALPARHERPRLPNPYVPPATTEQQQLAALWQELLGIAPVGLYDNFFALGGHSLLGTQMMARLRATFGVDLPLSALFENPTVADLVHTFREPVKGAVRLPLRPRPAGLSELPLSFAQQRLWFLDQLEPENPFYNIPTAFRLEGPFSPAIARAAFHEIVRRHESLRTTFPEVNGAPAQVISPQLEIDVPVEDLSALPEPLRLEHALGKARAEGRGIFDLARGPLLRVRVLRLGDEDHVLLLTMHHIISDGWSIQVFLDEFVTLYAAGAAGNSSPLPELPVQYADYTLWQRRWFEGGALVEQLAWWRDHLAGAPPALEMPTDRPYPKMQTFDGETRALILPPEPSAALSRVALATGASPFMALIAAFNVLLHRTSGQDDIVVGTPIANRTQKETEALIGMFVNTLALRTDLSGDPSFHELLARVRGAILGAYDHQDLPFDRLVEELQPDRTLSRPPLFQVVFQLLNQPVPVGAPGSFAARPFGVEPGIALFDLTLSFLESGARFIGSLQYNTGLFDTTTIDRLAGHFLTLLSGVAAHPEKPISELPFLSGAEQHQILVEWKDGGMPAAPEQPPLHRLFEAAAARRPEAIAITTEEGELTYGDLDRCANRLARHLRALGAGPEVRVGLCLHPSQELVVAILAILKSGAAYVPLDPGYPQERLAFLLEDSRAPLVVTRSELAGSLPGLRQVLLDTDGQEIARRSSRPLPGGSGPDHPAYVIYTSGSTGRPKGVVVTHRNVSRLFGVTEPGFGFGEEDVWTLFHSFAFDFSVWEIWGALLYGGRLVVVPWWVSRAPDTFVEWIRREGVTVLNQTPSAFRQLIPVACGETGALPLRWVIFGGEALDPRHLAPWVERFGDRPRLVNMYGITETTVHVTWRVLTRADALAAYSPIGRSIPDLTIRLLDAALRPVPIGVPGEICVGGEGLARGYLGRPELTAARFIPDPFTVVSGARLYRSGDLARWLSDGSLEVLGRLDHQVKIRGFRIELGEIEATLESHPGVKESAVLARDEGDGERRLVAYVVPAGEEIPAAGLREFLQERLPAHMVPAAFVTIPALPLTRHGKLDRAALPAPVRAAMAAAPFNPPETPVEQALAGIWAELLGFEEVGTADDFFDLGGHSLLATQVMSRVRSAFDVEMPLRELFEAPRLADLAARIEGARRAGVNPLIPPL